MDSAERQDLIHKVGISMVPGMKVDVVRAMRDAGYDYADFFKPGMGDLTARIGASDSLRFDPVERQTALERACREVDFMERHGIRGLFVNDDDYPPLLQELHDAPIMLYVLGNVNLNPRFALAVVGTRKATKYGLQFTEQLIHDLAVYYPDLLIVSGLAYGIDAAGHRAALDCKLPTVAVVAHGLDMVYPSQHRDLARKIIQSGGAMLTEYPTGTTPYQGNFLERNRIVAGLCDATFVAESEIRGGAMSTANQAFINNRDVMALPGRSIDPISAGCNHLIRSHKAQLITCAADVVQTTGWPPGVMQHAPQQRNLFPELRGAPAEIYAHIKHEGRPLGIDELRALTGMNMKELMANLTDMEFDGVITRLPGARFELG